jgi:hypothetical protein
LAKLLWRLSEAGKPAVLFGRQHATEEDAAFQRLLALGVLVHGERLTSWNACSDCDCGADERHVRWRGEMPVATCAADNRRDEVLTKDDLATFSLVIGTLVSETATALGLGPTEEVAPGLWRLGRLTDGRVIVAAPTRAGILLPGLIGALRIVDAEGPIVLIGPRLPEVRRAELARQGIHAVPAGDVVLPAGQHPLLGLDLTRLPDGNVGRHRLVLTPATNLVRFDGREAVLRPRPFQLLRILARQHRRGMSLVSRHDLHQELFSPGTADTAVRGLVSELQALLKKAFGADAVEGLIENRTGHGYLLTLLPLTAWINE